jgi:threonine dehydratase
MFNLEELAEAAALVHTHFQATPQYAWPLLAARAQARVVVKHENHTPVGAFKIRGGLVYFARLKAERPHVKGVVSATRGNHGQSLAYAGAKAGVPVAIVVPRGNSAEKNAAMRSLGAELVEYGADFDEARGHAAALAASRGYEFAPSFQRDLVLGVATYAYELFGEYRDLDAVYVPIGLGSGICGLIRTRDLIGLETKIVGVVADEAQAYKLSVDAGRVVETNSARTFADGMAVRVPSAEALAIVSAGAARIVSVGEDAIAGAMRAYFEDTHNVAEGAGAAPLAALLQEKDRMRGKTVGLILCGGNVDSPVFRSVLAGQTPVPA